MKSRLLMVDTSPLYLYVKLNWDTNCFSDREQTCNCMNSALYEYRNISVRIEASIYAHWKADYLSENLFHKNVVDEKI